MHLDAFKTCGHNRRGMKVDHAQWASKGKVGATQYAARGVVARVLLSKRMELRRA